MDSWEVRLKARRLLKVIMQELELDLTQRHEEEEKDWISKMVWENGQDLAVGWLCGWGVGQQGDA